MNTDEGANARMFDRIKSMFLHLAAVLPALALLSAHAASNHASEVNVFVGTQTNQMNDNGNTWPGAVRPFGMLYWSPDPVDGPYYRFEVPTTRGFSLTHLNGTGCGVLGDIPILPVLGIPRHSPAVRAAGYTASYSHSHEQGSPGYYDVTLDSGIRLRLAAQVRSGIAEIQYPAGDKPDVLLFDLSRNLNQVEGAQLRIEGQTLSGFVDGGAWCGMENHYRVYFSAEFDRAPESYGTWNELAISVGKSSESGPRSGGYVSFGTGARTARLKVGISYVSAANAAANLKAEIPGWDWNKVREDARAAWNEALSSIEITGGTPAQRRVFYTALYHTLIDPSTFSDVNGEYLGFDDKAHPADGRIQYANFSGWDIYRSQVQLLAMLFPKIGSDIAQSLVNDAEQGGGGLPKWSVANDESNVMVGDPSDGILAGLYAFGARDFDTGAALALMLRGADDPETHTRLYRIRPLLSQYLARGYLYRDGGLTEDKTTGDGPASVTLEYENADFAISRFAEAIGDHSNAERLLQRSAQWRRLFDPETRYIRPRDKDGKFVADFNPAKSDGFVEGNSAQYTWMIPYDMHGLIEALGGPAAANARLNAYFSRQGDVELPYFYINNEPSFENPWIYNWTGEPWKTQKVVDDTLTKLFIDAPAGLPGNDDLGATSSWVVLAELGLYPAIPGVGGLTLNTPMFPGVRVKLGGHALEISAAGELGARATIFLSCWATAKKPICAIVASLLATSVVNHHPAMFVLMIPAICIPLKDQMRFSKERTGSDFICTGDARRSER